MCVRHVPMPGARMMSQSPFLNGGESGLGEAEDPAEMTSARPSLPGTADGCAVDRVCVKGGFVG